MKTRDDSSTRHVFSNHLSSECITKSERLQLMTGKTQIWLLGLVSLKKKAQAMVETTDPTSDTTNHDI